MSIGQTLHEMLSERTGDIAPLATDDSEDFREMGTPVLTEWVLIACITDLDADDDTRFVVIAEPSMLRSHVVGLLEIARRGEP